MRRISFLSTKGGSGKSTLCLNVGAALAKHFGQRVLIVDLDGMACVTSALASESYQFEQSVGGVVFGNQPIDALVRPTEVENLFFVPGSPDMLNIDTWDNTDADPSLLDDQGRILPNVLAMSLARMRTGFEYVLFDCPGGVRTIEVMALMACDEVIIPTAVSSFDFQGIFPSIDLVESVQELRRETPDRPRILGIVVNQTGKAGIPENIQNDIGGFAPLFSPVRSSAALRTSPGALNMSKRTLVTAKPETQASLSLIQVAREIHEGIAAARADQFERQQAEVSVLVDEEV
jgi:chromosome partitioning protein